MWCRKTNIPIVERPGRRHETPGIVIIESNSEESVGNCGRKRHSAARTLNFPKSDVSRVSYCSKATATSSLAFFLPKERASTIRSNLHSCYLSEQGTPRAGLLIENDSFSSRY